MCLCTLRSLIGLCLCVCVYAVGWVWITAAAAATAVKQKLGELYVKMTNAVGKYVGFIHMKLTHRAESEQSSNTLSKHAERRCKIRRMRYSSCERYDSSMRAEGWKRRRRWTDSHDSSAHDWHVVGWTWCTRCVYVQTLNTVRVKLTNVRIHMNIEKCLIQIELKY